MKCFFLAILLSLVCATADARTWRADEIPNVQVADRMRYVSDPDGILPAAAVSRLDSLCAALRSQGLAQVAVVAVDDIEGGDPFSFAIGLFRRWGVGRKEVDNGLGILLVKDLREIRFVTGGGLEGVLPDALCKRIQLDYMLPYFRQGDYGRGMVAGVEAVAQVLQGGELEARPETEDDLPLWVALALFGVFLGALMLISIVVHSRSKRCPRCGAKAMKLQSQRKLESTRRQDVVEYTFVCPDCGYTLKRRTAHFKDDGGGMGGGMLIG
ncbi:MAG: TPM domain-containing protein, partial [Alistipes sp.]|nr:TPM domain-containing protein [Alistipes sp.]